MNKDIPCPYMGIPNYSEPGWHVHPIMEARVKDMLQQQHDDVERSATIIHDRIWVHHELCDSSTWWYVTDADMRGMKTMYEPEGQTSMCQLANALINDALRKAQWLSQLLEQTARDIERLRATGV